MQNSWHLDRRTFLKGTGVALSLPFLESMALGAGPKTAAELPRRMCCIYFPFGVSLPPEGRDDSDWNWFPKGEGRDFQFRNTGAASLCFLIATTPPWPGEDEAVRAPDHWAVGG